MTTAIDNFQKVNKQYFISDSESSLNNDSFFFRFFHEITFRGKIPRFLYDLKYFIVIFQTAIASFWLTSSHLWNLDYSPVDIFGSFIDFRIHYYEDAYSYYICGIVLFLLLCLWSLYISISFQQKKSLSQNDIYFSAFLLYFIGPIICPILAAFTARCYIDIIDIGNPGSIIFLIIYIFIFLIVFVFVTIASDFKIMSPVLLNSSFTEWFPIIHRILMFTECLCAIGPVFSRLPEWLQITYTFCIAILYFIMFLLIQMKPFLHSYANIIASIATMYFFIQEVSFSFKVFIQDHFPILYAIVIPICITVIFTPFYLIWNNHRKKDILSFLDKANDIFVSGHKDEYFQFRNFGNLYNTFPYIQLGIENNSSSIIDRSFLHYLAYTYRNKSILFSVIRVLCVFPTENQFTNLLISAFDLYKNISLPENFFIYQMKKIIIARQNENSTEIQKQIHQLRKLSEQTIELIRGLWLEIIYSKSEIHESMFRSVYQSSNKVKMQFLDLLNKYSNNYELCDDYSKFLIEGMSDFSGSIEWEKKKRMIEEGSIDYIDPAFRSFVNIYNQYLTKKIMDVKGNFIYEQNDNSASITSAPLLMSNNADYLEENTNLIESTISQGMLRLSIQNAFNHTHFNESIRLQSAIIFQTIFSIFLFLICAIFLPKTNNGSIEILNFLQLTSSTSLSLLLTSYYQCIQMAIDNVQFDPEVFEVILGNSIEDNQKIRSIYDNNGATANSTENSSILFAELMKSLSNYSRHSDLSSFFTNTTINMSYFNYYILDEHIPNLTFRQVFQNIVSLSNTITTSFFFDYVELTDYRLTLSYNCQYLAQYLEEFKQLVLLKWNEFYEESKNMNRLIGFVLPVLLFICFIPVQVYCVYKIYQKTKFVMKQLTKIKPEVVEKSLLPIQMSKIPQPLSSNSYLPIVHSSLLFIILLSILCMLSVIFPCIVLAVIPNMNYNNLNYMDICFSWYYISGTRLSTALTATSIIFASLIEDLDRDFLQSIYNSSIDTFFDRHNILFNGNEDIPTIIGSDEKLDEFQLLDRCDQSENSTALARYIKCLSIDRAISTLTYYFKKMSNKLHQYGELDEFDFAGQSRADFISVLELNLIDTISAYQSLLFQFINKIIYDMDQTMIITYSVSIFVSLFVFLIGIFYLLHYLDLSFQGLKQMIRFLPPDYIINSPQMLNLNLDDEVPTKINFMNQSQTILSAASDGIASIRSNCLIESFNQSFEKLTGYYQEQWVGQSFKTLFSNNPDQDIQSDHRNSMKKLNDSFEMMLNGVNALYDTFPMHCQLENQRKLNIQTYIIGVEDTQPTPNRSTDYIQYTPCSSFLIVFCDLCNTSQLKKQCDKIKEHAQNLIKQILPPEVYRAVQTSPLSGSTSFKSENATILVINIIGISDLIHSRLPQSVLSMISTFFDRFDSISQEYPAVHSIHSSELLYMACCGLFDHQDQPKQQISQAVLFAFDALREMQSFNKDYNTSLELKLLINYGGPIIGSVPDNKTPHFTLYGDIISEAKMALSMAQQGIVQILPAAHDILQEDNRFQMNPIQATNNFQTIDLYEVSLKSDEQ